MPQLCEICIIQDTYETVTHQCQTCGLFICDDEHALDHERLDNEAKDSTYNRIKTAMENDTELTSWLFPNEDQAASRLEEVNKYYTHSCSVCGKNSSIPKNGPVDPSHFTGCIRMWTEQTYW